MKYFEIKIPCIFNVLQSKSQIVKLQGRCLAFCTVPNFSFVVHNGLIKCCAKNNSCDFHGKIPVTQYNCTLSHDARYFPSKNGSPERVLKHAVHINSCIDYV